MDCLELPPGDRLKLARILLDLSEPDRDVCPAADEAWEEEISDRIRAVMGGTAESLPLAEALAELDRRFYPQDSRQNASAPTRLTSTANP